MPLIKTVAHPQPFAPAKPGAKGARLYFKTRPEFDAIMDNDRGQYGSAQKWHMHFIRLSIERYSRVIHTKLEPMKKFARTIKERLANAVAEGINSKIQPIKRRVGGYRNQENFKIANFFYCGGLDLYPR